MKLAGIVKVVLKITVIGLASCRPFNIHIEKNDALNDKEAIINENNVPDLWIGPLTTDWIVKDQNLTEFSSVILSSEGGTNNVALKIAENLLVQRRSAMVVAFCYSGCAGILPFFEEIEFVDEPSVGFHWNALIMKSALTSGQLNQLDNRENPFLSNTQKRLEAQAGFDSEVWWHVQNRINVRIISLSKSQDSYQEGSVKWESKHNMWFPTSNQMKDLLGLEFKGSVCADNPICIKQRVEQWSTNSSVIVGDTIYKNGKALGKWKQL
ncbi:MAG: hypothetical protein ABJG88_08430 [Litorimonas sp.]